MKPNNQMFNDIEHKTGVDMNQIMQVVNSLKSADLTDERTARRLVQQVSAMANKPVSKQKEDRLVKAITNKNIPSDLSFISQILNNKR